MARKTRQADTQAWEAVRTFLAFCDEGDGKLATAATKLQVAPTTVRRHIDELGKIVDAPLVLGGRQGRDVILTAQGQDLRDTLRLVGVDAVLQAMWQRVVEALRPPTLRVAAGGVSIQRYVLPALKAWYGQPEHAECRVEACRMDHACVREQVRRWEVDVGIGAQEERDDDVQQWKYDGTRLLVAYPSSCLPELGSDTDSIHRMEVINTKIGWVMTSTTNKPEDNILRVLFGKHARVVARVGYYVDAVRAAACLGSATICSEHFVTLFPNLQLSTCQLPPLLGFDMPDWRYKGAILWMGPSEVEDIKPTWKRDFIVALKKAVAESLDPAATSRT